MKRHGLRTSTDATHAFRSSKAFYDPRKERVSTRQENFLARATNRYQSRHDILLQRSSIRNSAWVKNEHALHEKKIPRKSLCLEFSTVVGANLDRCPADGTSKHFRRLTFSGCHSKSRSNSSRSTFSMLDSCVEVPRRTKIARFASKPRNETCKKRKQKRVKLSSPGFPFPRKTTSKLYGLLNEILQLAPSIFREFQQPVEFPVFLLISLISLPNLKKRFGILAEHRQ